MITEAVISNNIQESNPFCRITNKQFIEGVHKFGALMSMIVNRKLNPSGVLELLFEREDYQQIFVDITGAKDFRESIQGLLQLYPVLIKSKNTKRLIKKLHGPDRARKIDIQQTLSALESAEMKSREI